MWTFHSFMGTEKAIAWCGGLDGGCLVRSVFFGVRIFVSRASIEDAPVEPAVQFLFADADAWPVEDEERFVERRGIRSKAVVDMLLSRRSGFFHPLVEVAVVERLESRHRAASSLTISSNSLVVREIQRVPSACC